MTSMPTTPTPAAAPAPSEPMHGCVRCGARIPISESMCERCNPLGLKAPAASQAHGTAILGVAVAVVILAVIARIAVAGIGPWTSSLVSVGADPAGLRVTISITNAGSNAGATTCRIGDPAAARDRAGDGVRPEPDRPARGDGDVRRRRDQPRDDAEDAQRRLRPVTTEAVASRFAADLEFAREIAERAGRILFERYERVEQVDYKSARDVVTEVDHLSEALVIEAIRARFPGDGILAEESGAHRKPGADGTGSLAAGRTWVIDPLDGTINYANGIPFFCVSVGLVVDGVPSVGVIHDPMRGETFAADVDGPAVLGRRHGPRVRQGQAGRLRRLARARRAGRRDTGPRDPEGHPRVAQHGLGGARPGLRRQRALRCLHPVRAGCRRGTSPRPGLIVERAGATVTGMAGGPWFDVERATRTFGMIAAPSQHHAELLRIAARAGLRRLRHRGRASRHPAAR